MPVVGDGLPSPTGWLWTNGPQSPEWSSRLGNPAATLRNVEEARRPVLGHRQPRRSAAGSDSELPSGHTPKAVAVKIARRITSNCSQPIASTERAQLQGLLGTSEHREEAIWPFNIIAF